MADGQQFSEIDFNVEMAKAIVELVPQGGRVKLKQIRQSYDTSPFLIASVYKGSVRFLGVPDRVFLIDEKGGYHRLPDTRQEND